MNGHKDSYGMDKVSYSNEGDNIKIAENMKENQGNTVQKKPPSTS